MALKLFEISLKNHNFKTVIDYLKLLQIENYDDTVKKISNIFGDVFRKDRHARNVLLPELAKIPQGRFYFYESFVDIEFLHIYFADALHEYEKHINFKDKNKSKRDLIFANSLYFLNNLRTNKKKKIIQQGFKLIEIQKPNEANIETIKHHFPLARYYSSYLIYLFLTDKLTEKELNRAILLLEEQIIQHNNSNATSFILLELFRALYLIGEYNLIIFFYEKYNVKQMINYKGVNYFTSVIDFVKLASSKLNINEKNVKK